MILARRNRLANLQLMEGAENNEKPAKTVHPLDQCVLKKLENHVAVVGLYVAHYNFCRVHETLRVTPAKQLGVTDHIWTIGELVDAALEGVLPAPGR